jgi:hypothetical protein
MAEDPVGTDRELLNENGFAFLLIAVMVMWWPRAERFIREGAF